jgi:hypothetical protein
MQSNSDEMKIRIITAPVEMMSRFGYYKSLVLIKKTVSLNYFVMVFVQKRTRIELFFFGRKTT